MVEANNSDMKLIFQTDWKVQLCKHVAMHLITAGFVYQATELLMLCLKWLINVNNSFI